MNFADLRLAEPILRAVSTQGYTTATPVQAQSIPHVLAGRDLLGSAQTGTGKTAAFALPILHRMMSKPSTPGRGPRCLILCPTRELATQIAGDFRAYGANLKFKISTVFGGVNQRPQVQALRQGVDVLIATSGRLLDLMNQGHTDFRSVETLVLDEADRMLDMGFIRDIRKIVATLPTQRQTLLFSATMPQEIRQLAERLLKNPARVQIIAANPTAERIKESVYFVKKCNKPALLAHLFDNLPMSRAIVFTRTKHGADRVVRALHGLGIRSEAIHGNKSQNARQKALENFRSSRTPLLIATDIASRGIDIDDVSHVVNYDITHEPETYVHRIGRTARAGASGEAVSFCDHDEMSNLKGIERLIRRPIPVKTDHPVYTTPAPDARPKQEPHQRHSKPFRAAAPTHAPSSHRAPQGHAPSTHRAAPGHAPAQGPRRGGVGSFQHFSKRRRGR